LSDQRLPWLSARRQPLSEDEIERLVEPAAIVLPPELRLWWRRFNGAAEPRRVELTPIFEVVSLEVALQGRETLMGVAANVSDTQDEADKLFPPMFLPVFGTGGSVTIAANAAFGPATPLHEAYS
jgi:hypothetical protein